MAGKKWRRRSPDLPRRAILFSFFLLGIVFSPLARAPPDCNFKFLRCNGTERLNFFCEFLGDEGEGGEKKRIIPFAHAIVLAKL